MPESWKHYGSKTDDEVWKMINALGPYQKGIFDRHFEENKDFRWALFVAKSFSMEEPRKEEA